MSCKHKNMGDEICPQCRDRRTIPLSLHIEQICPTCGGNGCRDWIDHARGTKSPVNYDVLTSIIKRNIMILSNMIRDEAHKIGTDVQVSIEPIPKYNPYYDNNSIWYP